LCEECAEQDQKTAVQNCVTYVAQKLGNTRAVSRNYYIHPHILEAYEEGTLCELYEQYRGKSVAEYGLLPEEKTLLALIEQST
ncbi:MAG: DNA topoisomerase IB, partial [Anaerolineae bacterium]|nr:DNA topoisomerase IB [Anaerolineae bacterium]